jgi:DNA-binding PadR family transcriptional regulator
MAQLTPDETLLGLLATANQHGYQLLECFRDPSQLGEVWNLSTSQLYAVLKRLAAQGLIVGREIESVDAPTRTEYQLTKAGTARLHAWLQDEHPSASIRKVRVEFLSRLYIARLLKLPTKPIVQYQKAACQQMRAELVEQLELIRPGIGSLALELVIAQIDAVLHWIDRPQLIEKDMVET